jgi:dihydrofolate synthase/folylpolyglutamate synthase
MPTPQTPSQALRRDAAIKFLLGQINYERASVVPYGQRHMKLDRMRQLLTRLGNPDAGMPIVHVAGTKGKGSTSALIGSILHSAGYQVGLFSSPHLECIEERFAINGLPCSADELVGLVDRLRPVVQAMDQEGDNSMSPTYFELTTAIALMYFAQQNVDIAILEVGLGGRLDSTNVCQPAVTVITSISLDHTKQLGDSLAKIAGEKAGIIKPGVPVLCGPLDHEPRQVIANIAKQHGCRLIEAGTDFTHQYHPPTDLDQNPEPGRLDFSATLGDQPITLPGLPLQLLGAHQAANAALAVATCVELQHQGWSIAPAAIRSGLHELTLPARIEIIGRQPTVILDAAHNVASAQALVDVLSTSFRTQNRILVLAVSQDKDVPGIVRTLLPHFSQVIATCYQDNPRAVPTDQLTEIIRTQLQVLKHQAELAECPTPDEAWQWAQRLATQAQADQPLICITGSFFIAAELRQPLIAAV